MLLWVILLVAAAVGLYAIIIFNSLVRTRWPMRPGAGSTSSSNATPIFRSFGPGRSGHARCRLSAARCEMIASSTTSVRSRRRSARGLLSIAIGHWLAGPGCSLAAEVISSFDSDVRLAKDGELTVTETVRVQAEGRDIRHGIYRDFPLTFKDAGGVIREVDFSLISVERDGRPEEYSTTASAASSASIPAAKARSFQAASTRTSSAIGRDGRCAGSTANRS